MIVSQIAAMAKNRVIGKNNGLPWELPEDMKFFRETTKNRIVIMGRKTWQAIGSKPLPKRLNIILTREPNFKAEGGIVTHTINEAIEKARGETKNWGEEVFIIGGAEVYKLGLPFTDRIYLTEIDQTFEGDAIFPEFDPKIFKLVQKTERTGPINFAFCTYQKVLNP